MNAKLLTSKKMTSKRLLVILAAVTILLSIPFIAMQFTDEVKWTILDFAVMGVLLFATGILIDLVMRKVKSTQNRIILCATVLMGFLLIWAELAVGIFGSPFAGS